MIRSLTIDNFRGFEHFELHDLGRVNLIVGSNNSGKTSVLEAVELLNANGDSSVLSRIHLRRAESFEGEKDPRRGPLTFLDVKRLFHNHSLTQGTSFKLTANDEGFVKWIKAEVIEYKVSEKVKEHPSWMFKDGVVGDSYAMLGFDWFPSGPGFVCELGNNDAITLDSISSRKELHSSSPSYFISAGSLTALEAVELFSQLQLRPKEDSVYSALQLIEPDVQRIAVVLDFLKSRNPRTPRGGFSVLMRNGTEPIPIGSLGEGIWRMLGLALCLARAENGILLIDEIDTGLHYSVMVKMWKMLTETARKLNIQVFATSHSRDCYESLAAVCRESVTDNSEVTIQRIERGKKRSVAYTEQEIVIAAEHGTEVR